MAVNADKVRHLHDSLIAQVEALASGEDWTRSLSTRVHTYSTGVGGISKVRE